MLLSITMNGKKSIKKSNNTDKPNHNYEAIVIGTSAGGMAALNQLVGQIDQNFDVPVIVVQHLYPNSDDFIARNLNTRSAIPVSEANEKEKICSGHIYVAPANYHLLIEDDRTFSLTIDPKVNFSRPSIDVLFESAAEIFSNRLVGVLLTGANSDGARGLKRIKERGGITIVQDPNTAEVPTMPAAAINLFPVDYILPLGQILPKIRQLIESDLK
jgi:two-component system, chemotaxis family, protein-glutamate methylesterase/glutaminase